MAEPILEVEDLAISFSRYERGLRRTELEVISGLSVTVDKGELLAVVGSSGSGKSLLAHALLGLLPSNCGASGILRFEGEPLDAKRIAALRGRKIVLIPQSVAWLDPLRKVGPQVRGGLSGAEATARQEKLFDYYGLDRKVANLFPFELSGGMARRVLLSAAMMETPSLVIADEPTPGLHLSAAKKAMRHLRLMADQGRGVLLITHDLELALETADKIAVFYAGATVEVANASDFEAEEKLRHPYAKALWRALPQNGFAPWPGNQPYAGDKIKGCAFAPRCRTASPECGEEIPARPLRGGLVRCAKAV